jgi:glutaryl-CoA dehydrogenase
MEAFHDHINRKGNTGLNFAPLCATLRPLRLKLIRNCNKSSLLPVKEPETRNKKPETPKALLLHTFERQANPVFCSVFREVAALKFKHRYMSKDQFQSPDYFLVDDLLTDEQKLIRETVRSYVKKEISPIIEDYAQRAEFPQQIVKQLGDLGCFGPTVPEAYGGGGLDYISYGLMMQELERGDSGVRSTASVQGSLVMFPIYAYGNEEQRKKYLPKLASGEWLGCFGLTEPDHGSNPSGMLTNFREDGDHVILNGSKMWISNAPYSQVAVVWAKDEAGDIRGLIVERGMEGFSTPTTHGKWSLRASATGELVFDNVKVPKENILPNVKGLKGPLGCLTKARYGISWGALGAAMDCYDTALRYSKERIQFDRPIGGFQLQQKKLAEMITEITKAQLMVWRLGTLMNEGRATPQQVSMAKRNSCEIAVNITRDARQMLGGMGITGEYSIMRHMMNLESVITYEGTHDVHLLITGMDVTGLNAFK